MNSDVALIGLQLLVTDGEAKGAPHAMHAFAPDRSAMKRLDLNNSAIVGSATSRAAIRSWQRST
jgi:hypothetical protein